MYNIIFRTVAINKTAKSPIAVMDGFGLREIMLGDNRSDFEFIDAVRKQNSGVDIRRIQFKSQFDLSADKQWYQPSSWSLHHLNLAFVENDLTLLKFKYTGKYAGKQENTSGNTFNAKQIAKMAEQKKFVLRYNIECKVKTGQKTLPFMQGDLCQVFTSGGTVCLTNNNPVS